MGKPKKLSHFYKINLLISNILVYLHHNKTEYMLSSLIKRNAGSNEPKSLRVGNTTFPENQPSLNEWLIEYKVGIALPKRVIVTKEQIAKKFRVNTNELVII